MSPNEYYSKDFYSGQVDGSVRSAKVILPLVYGLYQPRSVIDFGCGRGGWLETAESLGSSRLRGLDGNWVNEEDLLSDNIEFESVDFEEAIEIDERFDLCISLEVAEHISGRNANRFIRELCSCSDVVLFSAAIKEQGGTRHINEQRQSYWIKLFKSNGYACLDVIRPLVWNNEEVQYWYRQNAFLFVCEKSDLLPMEQFKDSESLVADIVHPDNYEKKIIRYRSILESHEQTLQYPSLVFCLRCIKNYVIAKIERITGARHSAT
jgi:hypothetical protein